MTTDEVRCDSIRAQLRNAAVLLADVAIDMRPGPERIAARRRIRRYLTAELVLAGTDVEDAELAAFEAAAHLLKDAMRRRRDKAATSA